MLAKLKDAFSAQSGKKADKDGAALDNVFKHAGFAYDPVQDIFYSRKDAWQKNYGYCQLYDEANAPLNMIVDCEPVRFEYEEKKWLIELWKGQYGMTSGCEIGVYTSKGPNLNIEGVFNGAFYHCAADEDQLRLSYLLRKNQADLFGREDKHWWLTGFKMGEFSEPEELVMEAGITLKDQDMLEIFLSALEGLDYWGSDLKVRGNTVSLVFAEPHSPQPLSRTRPTDWLIQRKNQFLCRKYQQLTGDYDNTPDKLTVLKEKEPAFYSLVFNMAKPKQLFMMDETIKQHIEETD